MVFNLCGNYQISSPLRMNGLSLLIRLIHSLKVSISKFFQDLLHHILHDLLFFLHIIDFFETLDNFTFNLGNLTFNFGNFAIESIFQLVSCFLSGFFYPFGESNIIIKIESFFILDGSLNYQSNKLILYIKEA